MLEQPKDLEGRIIEPATSNQAWLMTKKEAEPYSLPLSWLILLCIYTVVVLVSWLFVSMFTNIGHLLTRAFVVDLLATCVVFVFSLLFQNSSIYDPFVSVANIAIAWYWYDHMSSRAQTHGILCAIAITLFSLRFLGFYFRNWVGLSYEHARYSTSRRKYSSMIWMHWLISFLFYHVLNSLIFFAALIPAYYVFEHKDHVYTWLLAVGFAICIVGVLADAIIFYYGLWLMAMSCNLDLWWTVAGPVALTIVLAFTHQPYIEYRVMRTLMGRP